MLDTLLLISSALGLLCGVLLYRKGMMPKFGPTEEHGQVRFLRKLLTDSVDGLRGIRGRVRTIAPSRSPGGEACASYFSAEIRYPLAEDGSEIEQGKRYDPSYDAPAFEIENEREVCRVDVGSAGFLLPDDPTFRPGLLTLRRVEYHLREGDLIIAFGHVVEEAQSSDTYRTDGRTYRRMTAPDKATWVSSGDRTVGKRQFFNEMSEGLSGSLWGRPWVRFIPGGDFERYARELRPVIAATRAKERWPALFIAGCAAVFVAIVCDFLLIELFFQP